MIDGSDLEQWQTISELNDEAVKEVLREDGVLEKDLDEEMVKLRTNQVVQSNVRSVLITPELDTILKKLVDFAITGGMCKASLEEIRKVDEIIWPQ